MNRSNNTYSNGTVYFSLGLSHGYFRVVYRLFWYLNGVMRAGAASDGVHLESPTATTSACKTPDTITQPVATPAIASSTGSTAASARHACGRANPTAI